MLVSPAGLGPFQADLGPHSIGSFASRSDEMMAIVSHDLHALEFLEDQYRHAKPILALGAGADLVETAAIPATLPSGEADPGLLIYRDKPAEKILATFVAAVASHRHHEREMDPPKV